MFHELHRSGANTHAAAARFLPLRQTQVRDAIKLLPGVRDVAALSGGIARMLSTWRTSLFHHTQEGELTDDGTLI